MAPHLSEELGCSPTLSILLDANRYWIDGLERMKNPFFFFDPLQLATDENSRNAGHDRDYTCTRLETYERRERLVTRLFTH